MTDYGVVQCTLCGRKGTRGFIRVASGFLCVAAPACQKRRDAWLRGFRVKGGPR